MLFLYRPRQTWMPYSRPLNRTEQMDYNRQLQAKFQSTCRATPAPPAAAPRDTVSQLKDLAALHESGALSDAEFQTAKSKLLGP